MGKRQGVVGVDIRVLQVTNYNPCMWHAHLGTCQDGGLHIPNPCPHTPTLLLAFGPLLPWIWDSSCTMAICSTPPPLRVYTLNHVWPQLSESYENLSCFGLVFDKKYYVIEWLWYCTSCQLETLTNIINFVS